MNPNSNLQEQERILTEHFNESEYSEHLRDLRIALKQWLNVGGFKPNWSLCPKASAYFRLLRYVR